MIEGIDVSAWQAAIDWPKAYDAGARFAIIRAGSVDNTTGVCWTDFRLGYNANTACKLMPVSFYWFFRPNHSAVKQAEYFIGLLDQLKDFIGFHVWCDIEVAGQAAVVKSFCELVNAKYPIGIYTNPNTALYLLTGDKSWMKNYPLWLADWSAPANVPAPWTEYKIWQYAVRPDGAAWGMGSASLDHDQMVDGYLPPTPPTPPPPVPPDPHTHPEINLEIEKLNDVIALFRSGHTALADELDKLTDRVTALEQQPPAPPPAPVTVFQVTAEFANANHIVGKNAAGRPMLLPYGTPGNRIQFKQGANVPVEPVTIVADGGGRFAKMLHSPVAGVDLYLRMVDGVLVS